MTKQLSLSERQVAALWSVWLTQAMAIGITVGVLLSVMFRSHEVVIAVCALVVVVVFRWLEERVA